MNTLNKELPKRFTEAISKLYNAFHENRLNSFDCRACAVGNMCDNNSDWATARGFWGGTWNYNAYKARKAADKIGYSLKELEVIEDIFCNKVTYNNRLSKEIQFKGLCAVITYLCELDNIPNILDFTSLFEFDDNEKPVKELQF